MQFSLSQLVQRAAAINRDPEAIVFSDRVSSWSGILDQVRNCAAVLRNLGLKPGERAAILALNSDVYLQCLFAVPWAGGILVPINTRLAASEITQMLNDAGCRLLLLDDSFISMREQIASQLETVERYIHCGLRTTPHGCLSLQELMLKATPCEDAARGGDDLAALFYTGGTTGRPKGVMLTHAGLITGILQWLVAVGLSQDDRMLIVAPMFHVVAALNCIAAALLGASVSVLPKFDPAAVLAQIQDLQVSTVALVPTMIHALVQHPEIGRYDLRSLRRVTYGGSPMSETLLERALEVLPHTQFIQIYGQTEAGPSVSALPHKYHVREGRLSGKMGSAGQPLPGVDVSIRDDNGALAPIGVIGEICLKSPSVSPGYWHQPDQSALALRGGVLHTGDAGYIDAHGFLYVVDRVKDMIITGGENVYPAEVERVLHQHAAVAECVVIGIPHELWGEQVHAIVRLREGASVTEQELITHCRALLGGFKCVRSVTFRTEPFPLSGANKILKRELRAAYWQGHKRSL